MTANKESMKDGPKYERIYLELREAVSVGVYRPGDKLPSESDLVTKFGASRPTVRRALAQLESEGFVETRKGSGSVVLERATQRRPVFGLLIPELGMTEIFEPICQGISRSHLGGQHDLLWGPTSTHTESKEEQAKTLCDYYIERKVSGVFFAPIELSSGGAAVNDSIVRSLEQAHIPIVLLDRDICHYPERSKFDLVGIDNQRAGFLLTRHLLDAGASRPAFFARPYSAHTVDARIAGYREALRSRFNDGIPDLARWIDPVDITSIREFIEQFRPDAVICANDYTAAQLMSTLNTLGIHVPSQMMVAGFDDVKYARLLQSPLTTVHQPCTEIGAAALLAMLDRIAHPNAPARDILVDFQLVVRNSTSVGSARTHAKSRHATNAPVARAKNASAESAADRDVRNEEME